MKTFELIEVIWKEAYGDTPVKIRKENFDPEKHRMVGGEKAFCVNIVMFNTTNDLSCAEQELDEAQFRRVEIGGEKSATFDFLPAMFAPAAHTYYQSTRVNGCITPGAQLAIF